MVYICYLLVWIWFEYSRQLGHFGFLLRCIDLWYTSIACWFGLCFELGFIAEFKNVRATTPISKTVSNFSFNVIKTAVFS